MHVRLAMLVLALAACPAPPKAAGKYVMKGGNFIEVSAAPNGQLDVSLSGSYGMNTCQVETGPQEIDNCEITYTQNEDGDNCTIRISFESQSARVEQKGVCGCGLNVNLSGEYLKRRKASRKGSSKGGS